MKFLNYNLENPLGAHHQISGEGVGRFFCVELFFGSFGAARFSFLANAEIFSDYFALHDFFY